MKQFENLTLALEAIMINWAQRGYNHWTSFVIDEKRLAGKSLELNELYQTKAASWLRQDRKQKGLPTCVAVSAPVLGLPGKREVILQSTELVQTVQHDSVWAREKWNDRCITFGSYVMVKEPRPRGDYAWTWRLQERIYQGIKKHLLNLVKSGNVAAVRTETQSWPRCYTMFGGVRRQFRRLILSASKLWKACHGSAWPGLQADQLPMKIGFTTTSKDSDS